MSRKKIKIGVALIMLVIGVFLSITVNWLKLSPTEPIVGSNNNVFLREVDSTFVLSYGLKYEKGYIYFLRGDIETKTYRSNFLNTKTTIDTVNVVLDKKIDDYTVSMLKNDMRFLIDKK